MATAKVSVEHTVSLQIDGGAEPVTLSGTEAEGAVYAYTHGQPIVFTDEGCAVYVPASAIVSLIHEWTTSESEVEDATCVTDDTDDADDDADDDDDEGGGK